ncbi:non-oxidative hydroxyarylic acid decarboxylases subunit B [Ammoniphilus sp. YIM 78166]|uniref:non-oxidative hydroxyarylic acid decarboxylases subunit B n=1 Tax=Ammoniphilus sp. YIM 78166 TaxID=1644106 RepID=UPI00106F74F1|nr:non-oxidative hydroxyarylic acid decarboxylases subunit B [Ammoniphilus sp. YIM 78166]
MRLIVGITGATGAIYGIHVLEALKACGVETHLILSTWAETTIKLETDYSIEDVKRLASNVYSSSNLAASVSSGSFRTDGMIIAPCSMKTLSGIAHGYADNLIVRAADVILKEKRKLVLLTREAPLNEIHLENMLKLSRMGSIILPPMPAFYNHPKSIEDIIKHTVARTLDQFDIENSLTKRWLEK